MIRNRLFFLALITASSIFLTAAYTAERRSQKPAERWVCSWAIAQQMLPGTLPGQTPPRPPSRPASSPSAGESAQPASSVQRAPSPPRFPRIEFPAKFADQTIRMTVRPTLEGHECRVALSNMFNAQAVEVGTVHLAVYKQPAGIVPGSDRTLTFGGKLSTLLQPGTLTYSDALKFEISPAADLAISLYFPHDTGAPTLHMQSRQTVAYLAMGDATAAESLANPTPASYYAWISSIDVLAPANDRAIVAFGDSITDSLTSWAPLLSAKLQANPATRHIAVVSQGIAGNQVLRDGAGISGLARFDRDVLGRSGVKWIVLLEGVNDIQLRGMIDGPDALTASELIGGYKQIIQRAHMYGIRVAGATVTPYMGVRLASEHGEKLRQSVNQWIRTPGNFDSFFDFDAAVRDPNRPGWLKQEFDSGDHIHPNDAGQRAMADVIDVALFRRK